VSDNKKEDLRCLHCGAIARTRLLAAAIVHRFGKQGARSLTAIVRDAGIARSHIYEAQSTGPIHDVLRVVPGYACSEFMDDIAPGLSKNGVRCENMEHLTFDDAVFDLVIHQSVLEHVRRPALALRECLRVMRPGGWLIFEVPVCDYWVEGIRPSTVLRVDTSGTEDVPLLPHFYHLDPLRPEGVLVYTDFGLDLQRQLEDIGFAVEVAIEAFANSRMSHAAVFCAQKQ